MPEETESQYRARLLSVTEAASAELTVAERYDRIRYLREQLGAEHIDKVRRTLPKAENKAHSEKIIAPVVPWWRGYED